MEDVIIVGLISGVLGVVVAGLLQMRGGRLEQLRERQIAAADDFATAATEVFVALTTRMETLGPSEGRTEEWLAGFKEATEAARKDVHQITRRLARVELLFGVESPTASAAIEMVAHLAVMTAELRKESGDQTVVEQNYGAAADALGRFNKSANVVMTLPGWRQWLNRPPRSATVDALRQSLQEAQQDTPASREERD